LALFISVLKKIITLNTEIKRVGVAQRFYFLEAFIALISLRFLRSARASLKDATAHNAAGSQPIRVSCKMRQRMPVSILPLSMKDKNGKRIASSIITCS
jgi:hypothetical protein